MEVKVHTRESHDDFKVLFLAKKKRAVKADDCQKYLNQVVLLSLSENGICSTKTDENRYVWSFSSKNQI